MSTARKVKVSLTLSEDLLAVVDKDAKEHDDTRSAAVERWLRRAARADATLRLAEDTARYYRASRETDEDDKLSRALSAASKRARRK